MALARQEHPNDDLGLQPFTLGDVHDRNTTVEPQTNDTAQTLALQAATLFSQLQQTGDFVTSPLDQPPPVVEGQGIRSAVFFPLPTIVIQRSPFERQKLPLAALTSEIIKVDQTEISFLKAVCEAVMLETPNLITACKVVKPIANLVSRLIEDRRVDSIKLILANSLIDDEQVSTYVSPRFPEDSDDNTVSFEIEAIDPEKIESELMLSQRIIAFTFFSKDKNTVATCPDDIAAFVNAHLIIGDDLFTSTYFRLRWDIAERFRENAKTMMPRLNEIPAFLNIPVLQIASSQKVIKKYPR